MDVQQQTENLGFMNTSETPLNKSLCLRCKYSIHVVQSLCNQSYFDHKIKIPPPLSYIAVRHKSNLVIPGKNEDPWVFICYLPNSVYVHDFQITM